MCPLSSQASAMIRTLFENKQSCRVLIVAPLPLVDAVWQKGLWCVEAQHHLHSLAFAVSPCFRQCFQSPLKVCAKQQTAQDTSIVPDPDSLVPFCHHLVAGSVASEKMRCISAFQRTRGAKNVLYSASSKVCQQSEAWNCEVLIHF